MASFVVSSSEVLSDLWQALRFEIIMFSVTLVIAFAAHALSNRKVARKVEDHDQKSFGLAPQRRKAAPSSSAPAGSKVGAAGGSGRTSARCRNSEDAFLRIVEGTKENTSIKFAYRALQVYHEDLLPSLKAGVASITKVSEGTGYPPLQMYSILVNSAVRVGRCNLVEDLCEAMDKQGVSRTLVFYECTMRQLAKQRHFHLALAMYDRLDKEGLHASAVTMSCLIGFAAELGELQRAVDFFEKLSSLTTPSIRAYMAVLRVHGKRQDYEASTEILRDMEKRGVCIDSFALNIVLATCVASDQLATVEQLVTEGDARKPPSTDVISYNTMMKAWAQQGDTTKAKAALAKMQACGLTPNDITFNTAMDAMARGGRPRDAWDLLNEMRTAGLKPDKFTCSILIKTLGRVPTEKHVRLALKLLVDTDGSCDTALKSALYKHVLEAAALVPKSPNLVALAFSQMHRVGVRTSPAARRLLVKSLPAGSSRDFL